MDTSVFSLFRMFPQMMFHTDPQLLRLKGVIEDNSALQCDRYPPVMDPGPLFLIFMPPPAVFSLSFKLFHKIDVDDSILSPQASNLLLTSSVFKRTAAEFQSWNGSL